MIYGAISVYVYVTTGRSRPAVSTWLVLARADSDHGREAAVEISFTGARSGRLGLLGWTAGSANLILAEPGYHASYAPLPRYSWEPAVTYRRAIRSHH
jgi:hypothetical protein